MKVELSAEARAQVREIENHKFRRLLLKRTGYHVYAREESDRVYVVAVWSAHRGRGPRL